MADLHDKITRVPIGDLRPYKANPKEHPDSQIDKIKETSKIYTDPPLDGTDEEFLKAFADNEAVRADTLRANGYEDVADNALRKSQKLRSIARRLSCVEVFVHRHHETDRPCELELVGSPAGYSPWDLAAMAKELDGWLGDYVDEIPDDAVTISLSVDYNEGGDTYGPYWDFDLVAHKSIEDIEEEMGVP